MTNCIICKIAYEKSNFKSYCSLQCYNKSNRPRTNSVLLNCEYCGKLVLKFKSNIIAHVFCNSECSGYYNHGKSLNVKELQCSNCNNTFVRKISDLISRETHDLKPQNFCSRLCKGIFDSKSGKGIFDFTKSFVKKRSRLEQFIESKIRTHYPHLTISVCDRLTLNGLELDFYFPDLNIAIEDNGIVHYKPIYGFDQFEKIQTRDVLKQELCKSNNIKLIIITSISRFSEIEANRIWNNEIVPFFEASHS